MNTSQQIILPCGTSIGRLSEQPLLNRPVEDPEGFAASVDALETEIAKTDGANPYHPHLRAIRSRSEGYAQRVPSPSSIHTHHLLSRREFQLYLLLLWAHVAKIREQFALPVLLTHLLSKLTGIRHPAIRTPVNSNDDLAPLSVDFLVTAQNGKWIGIDFKMEEALAKKRTREKLQLSAMALNQIGIRHYVVTERDIPRTVVRNYDWLHYHLLHPYLKGLSQEELAFCEPKMRGILSDARTPVFDAASEVGSEIGITSANLSRACFWLIANGRWSVDLHQRIGPDYPLSFIIHRPESP